MTRGRNTGGEPTVPLRALVAQYPIVAGDTRTNTVRGTWSADVECDSSRITADRSNFAGIGAKWVVCVSLGAHVAARAGIP